MKISDIVLEFLDKSINHLPVSLRLLVCSEVVKALGERIQDLGFNMKTELDLRGIECSKKQ